MPRRPFEWEITRQVGKVRQRVDDDRIVVTDTFEPDMGDDLRSATLNEYQDNSLDRFGRIDDDRFLDNCLDRVEIVDDDRLLKGEKGENEHKVDYGLGRGIWTDESGDSWAKKRKRENDGRFLMNYVTENELFNDHGPRQAIRAECPGDCSGKVRRAPEDVWFLAGDGDKDGRMTDNNLGPVISAEYPVNYFNKGKRVAEDDRFLMIERVENECNMDNDCGPVSTEHHEKPFGKGRLLLDDNRFLINNYSGRNEHSMDNYLWPVIAAEHLRKPLGKTATDDRRFLPDSRLRNERYVGDGIGPVFSTEEHLGNLLGRVRRATDDGRSLMSGRVDSDPHISSEHLGSPMGKFRRATDDETLLIRNRVENEHNVGSGFRPGISTEYSRYTTLNEDRRVADDGWFRKSDRVENLHDMGSCLGLGISSDITAFCLSEQNIFMISGKPNLESDNSLLHDQLRHSSAFPHPKEPQTCTQSYLTSHDAMVTRTVPYALEVPDMSYCRSSPLVVSHNFNSVQDHSCYQGSERNFLSSSRRKSLPYSIKSESLARCLDVDSGNGNKVSLPNTSDHHKNSCYGTSNTFLNPGYPESSELRTSDSEGYKGSLYSESFLASLSFLKSRSIEKVNKGPLSYALSLSKNPSFAFGNGYPERSQSNYEHEIPGRESNEAFTTKAFSPSDAVWSCSPRLHYGSSSPQAQGMYRQEKKSVNHGSELYKSTENKGSDTKYDRTSVFARLSVAPEVCIQEEKDTDIDMVSDECDMDASADEVMDSLHQAHNHWVKMKKFRPSVRPNDDDESVGYKEKLKFQKQLENEQPMMTAKKMEIDANVAVKENGDTVLEETRLIDFKRRSKIKKNRDETLTKGSARISEGKTSVDNAKAKGLMGKTPVDNAEAEDLEGKLCKRRKLVRPDFGKKQSSDEGNGGDSTPNQRSPFHKSSLYKNNTGSCEDAVKSTESSDMSSRNVGVVHVTFPTTSTSKGNNTTSEQTPECKLNGNSKNCGASFRCQDSEDGKELSQDIDNINTMSQIPLKETDQDVRGGLRIDDQVKVAVQDLLSMIGSSSSAQDLPPVVREVTADCGNSKDKEENAKVAYPVSTPSEILKVNRKASQPCRNLN